MVPGPPLNSVIYRYHVYRTDTDLEAASDIKITSELRKPGIYSNGIFAYQLLYSVPFEIHGVNIHVYFVYLLVDIFFQ